MQANSSPISSTQTSAHEHLASVVAKHARTEFRKPFTAYNHDAFDSSMAAWHAAGHAPLILDAGCGVGLSTLHLAARFPDHFVIGVDQSASRLSRNTVWAGTLPSNFIRVRADLVDYWRLLHAAGVQLARHYILYPNPWPKIGHLTRRWHGHAVFPTVIALGGVLECRTNWKIYIDEHAAAVNQLTGSEVCTEQYAPSSPITPFEQKYCLSGHSLWRCCTNLVMPRRVK